MKTATPTPAPAAPSASTKVKHVASRYLQTTTQQQHNSVPATHSLTLTAVKPKHKMLASKQTPLPTPTMRLKQRIKMDENAEIRLDPPPTKQQHPTTAQNTCPKLPLNNIPTQTRTSPPHRPQITHQPQSLPPQKLPAPKTALMSNPNQRPAIQPKQPVEAKQLHTQSVQEPQSLLQPGIMRSVQRSGQTQHHHQHQQVTQKPAEYIPTNVDSILETRFEFLHSRTSISAESKESEVLIMRAKLLQWQFLKAKARFAYEKRKSDAECQIYAGWQCVRNLKSQIHALKSEIASRSRIKSELEMLQTQENCLAAVKHSMDAFESGYAALAQGLHASVVRMKLVNVHLTSPVALLDSLVKGTSRVKLIMQKGSDLFEKVERLSDATSSLKEMIATDTTELKECVRILENLSLLSAIETSYMIEKEQLKQL
ncbi:hypothetical protein BDR26DRAFT_1005561 [Obelidium mucronatum]|nr:hypothetical protein BDR26DRAFT_1005561 [Obelidium mucronatum]